jgi:hypothetical protein
MGASISLDTKYKLILDVEVECISAPAHPAAAAASKKRKSDKTTHTNDSGSGSGSGSGSESESGSESSGSGSDSEEETKIFTVKLTPEIIGYIRAYVRDNDFLDIMDTITEIELNEYGHGPESALVFDSQTVIYNANDNKIEASGIWEYIESPVTKQPPTVSRKSSRKHKSKGGSRSHGDGESDGNDDANSNANANGFKTKEDELAVSEIETIITERFKEYSKHHDFIIHESKTSILSLNIHSVEVVKD